MSNRFKVRGDVIALTLIGNGLIILAALFGLLGDEKKAEPVERPVIAKCGEKTPLRIGQPVVLVPCSSRAASQ